MSSIYGVSVGGNTYDITDSSNVAPKEPTSYASRNYNVGRCFIMSDGKLYKATQYIAAGDAIVVNGNVVQTNIDELFESITPEQITSITPMLNVLGAKNLLPNNATSQVFDRITYQVNPDGSVTALNGTALDGGSLKIYADEIYCETDMILSGCPSGGGNSSYTIWCQIKNSQDVYFDAGEGVLIPKGTTIYNISIGVAKDYTISNKTFYPMLRPASIADDTYVPYAMTNRELTERIVDPQLGTAVSLSSSDYTLPSSGYIKSTPISSGQSSYYYRVILATGISAYISLADGNDIRWFSKGVKILGDKQNVSLTFYPMN